MLNSIGRRHWMIGSAQRNERANRHIYFKKTQDVFWLVQKVQVKRQTVQHDVSSKLYLPKLYKEIKERKNDRAAHMLSYSK